jgi:hypothetical protein
MLSLFRRWGGRGPRLGWLFDPRRRREALTVGSGVLIALALLADYGADQQGLRSVLMVGAALMAGSDIAVRALRSLGTRDVSIERLVTLAAVGALLIGEPTTGVDAENQSLQPPPNRQKMRTPRALRRQVRRIFLVERGVLWGNPRPSTVGFPDRLGD